jgi:hypothetical protein
VHGVVAGRETGGSADATTGEPISNRDGEVAFGVDAKSAPPHAINTAAITGRQFCVLSRLVIIHTCPGSHPVIITGEKPPYRFGLPSSGPRPGWTDANHHSGNSTPARQKRQEKLHRRLRAGT